MTHTSCLEQPEHELSEAKDTLKDKLETDNNNHMTKELRNNDLFSKINIHKRKSPSRANLACP